MTSSRAGAVQRHGALLALAEHDLAIVIASANVSAVLGRDLDAVLGAGVASVLAAPTEKELRAVLSTGELASTNPIEARTPDGRVFDAVLHRASGMLVIELEPATHRVRTGRIDRALDRIASAPDVARAALDELKDILAMEHLALYSGGGELLAATEPPPDLVVLEPGETIQFIADRAAAPVELVRAQALGASPLDLTGAMLRAISAPGAGALLAIAAGEWGIVVAEHPEPLHVEVTARAAAQVIARAVGSILAAREEQKRPAAAAPIPAGELSGTKVLIVDDDVDQGDMLALLLETSGAVTEVAHNATEATAAFLRFLPDAVVSDITLPDKDGFTFIRELRALGSDGGGWIPAIAVTGHSDPEYVREAMLAGFQLHLAKPIDPADLVAHLTRLVGRTARRT